MDARSDDAADPAAVFAAANSLWEECRKVAFNDRSLDLSEAYNGWDQLMRTRGLILAAPSHVLQRGRLLPPIARCSGVE